MSSTARREGRPAQKDVYISKAKPARRQHVSEPEKARSHRGEEGEGIRLQKVLAQAGVASRRMSEQLIDEGRVEVNGSIVTRQGMRVNPEVDVIRVDGVRVNTQTDNVYIMLNKPYGVQSTMHDDMGRPCVGDIVGEMVDAGTHLFHVGRLDAETEGLLLITNDGELANRLMHPRYGVSKTYLATVLGEADKQLVKQLEAGLEMDDGPAKADYAQIVDVYNGKSLVRVELHEGRKHIVRRMLKQLGFPVQALVRTRIHTLQLGELPSGGFRFLNNAELRSLYKAVGL
ncbi:MAG: pseudouridine synthase [Corynebacterium sp.]|nr:pseudouridine synthase [Corynebacterium sp.]